MDTPNFLPKNEPRLDLGDWAFRLGVAALFVLFGTDKFPSHDSEWVRIFRQIGFGDWFRYFTGIVEVTGGLLILIPRTAVYGLTLLAVTMVGAVLAHLFAIHDGALTIVPGALALILGMSAYTRWSR